MTPKRPSVSSQEFVVQLPEGARAAEVIDKLRPLGTVDPIAGQPGYVVVRLADDAPTGKTPKLAWSRLRRRLGNDAGVFPTLAADDEPIKFPTGTIMVRFKEPPSDAAIAKLAKKHGLRAEERVDFAPTQVAFAPADTAATYLPELIDTIRDKSDLEAVWPVTLSAYDRGV